MHPTPTLDPPRVRVAIVASQPVVRVGVRHLLESDAAIDVVGEARSGDEAVRLVTVSAPHVIVLDTDGPDPSLPTIARLAQVGRGTVLVFTSVSDATVHGQAVALGAMGVVLKQDSAQMLRRAIACVHAGELWLARQTTATLLRELRKGRVPDPEDAKIQSLTPRELEVIALVGSGLKTDAIAFRLSISQATVRNHLTSILGKLDLADRFELAFYAAGHGLVDEQDGLRGLRRPRSVHGQPATGIRTLGGSPHALPTDVAADFVRRRKPRSTGGS